jgi:ADP-ribose pyrophosphatase
MPDRGRNFTPRAEDVSRRIIHSGRKYDFEQVSFPGEDGSVLTRDIVRHPGAVVVLPVLAGAAGESDRIVMVNQYRVTVGSRIWELPAGTRDRSEDPEVCARRELEEETGYSAATMSCLGRFYTTPGLTDELMWAYVAKGLTFIGQRLEADEHLTAHAVIVDDAWKMLDRGEITDAKTILVLLWARRAGMISMG